MKSIYKETECYCPDCGKELEAHIIPEDDEDYCCNDDYNGPDYKLVCPTHGDIPEGKEVYKSKGGTA